MFGLKVFNVSDTATVPLSEDNGHIHPMGFHGMPSFYTFEQNIEVGRIITGRLDQFNFPYIDVAIVNPDTEQYVTAKAIIDTGAHPCLLKPELITGLGLQHFRESKYYNPMSDLVTSNDYIINLIVDLHNSTGTFQFQNVRVGTIASPEYPAGMIIGIELLKHCNFTYKGKDGTFELHI
jgi:predicted aspartyl protease